MPSSSKASIATVQAAEPDLPNPLEEEETKQPVAPVEDLKEDDEEIESRYSDGNKEDEAEEPVTITAVEDKDDDQAATGETGTTDINSENLANPSD